MSDDKKIISWKLITTTTKMEKGINLLLFMGMWQIIWHILLKYSKLF